MLVKFIIIISRLNYDSDCVIRLGAKHDRSTEIGIGWGMPVPPSPTASTIC